MAYPDFPPQAQLDAYDAGLSGDTAVTYLGGIDYDPPPVEDPTLPGYSDQPVEYGMPDPGYPEPQMKTGWYPDVTLAAYLADNEPDPDPDPDPDPETPPTVGGQKVADFLGAGDDADLVALAGEHVTVITALVRAYTRDRGFDRITGAPNAGLGAVITSATARLVANPEQLRYGVGSVQYNSAFQGWSLAELAVLNRYRKRAS